ncbi:hypothetical protein KUH03_25830 [Sphingobacterium sp. E70]|uniref:hypothetical protein n=1 Tax=Sphingobacterium sp. E70 TaxID=2853439 RepID=UPI00211C1DE1|nr:hypothetical protein [Sphingobacterium sp. E70]ULT22729.1 hypothetical protein KUH03_25830 [Sphingobacterium sp. E70]
MKAYAQNLGVPKQQTDTLVHWVIESVGKQDSFKIEVGEKTSFLASTILWISPGLLAFISSLVLFYLHIRYIYKKYKIGRYRYALLIGNLIVPASFYSFCWFWSSLANYLVNGIFADNSRGLFYWSLLPCHLSISFMIWFFCHR